MSNAINYIQTNTDVRSLIFTSIDLLKKWSNKNKFNVIFDSDVDGNGYNNVLHNKVLNKKNLYFIHVDYDNNIFGGYINNSIITSGNFYDNWILDKYSFVFSLVKNGEIKNKRYFMKHDDDMAFWLQNNDPDGRLYKFGEDICVYKVGSNESWCTDKYGCYNYENDYKPFTNITHPHRFEVKRIVVLQMN